ncbi:MAG: BMP family protein [Lactobacillaceae bacterium]|jgi:basic membrane protein A|nr:BMP family protein [Lactobacillaceae bacterium]
MKKLYGLLAAIVAIVAIIFAVSKGGSSSKNDATSTKSSNTTTAKKFTAALITDTGGVDDKSFNQSAWEGLEKWGKDNGLSKGNNGYNYFQSDSESDFQNNINQAIAGKYSIVYGIGFILKQSIEDTAKQNPNTKFVLVDDIIKGQKNVVSATFADNQAAYLAGVAAAKTTQTKKVGFIGGISGEVLDRFEAGFVAGVHSVDKTIDVNVQYAGSFSDASKGKTIAQAMIANKIDVIYQAAGGVGSGVFAEAKAENESKTADAKDKVWILGVDRDQKDDGEYTSKDNQKSNFVLASTIKKVSDVILSVNKLEAENKFPGGKHLTFAIKDGGVDLVDSKMSDETKKAVDKARQEIKNGDITVPQKPSK